MNELIFRGKDLFRPSWSTFAVPLLALAALAVLGFRELGALGTGLLTAATVLVAVPAWILTLRSWSRVGADGITVCWGIGGGRTYAWEEVRWLDVREFNGNGMSTRSARIHLASGRRRSLPGLGSSTRFPNKGFDTDYRRVVNWWEYSTPPEQRVLPRRRFRDRVTPVAVGLGLGLVTLPLVVVIVSVMR
ncbi:hypothetical protein AB0E96_08440 [Kitasatospora sp. NPDC036755]|uniref:hypothetical protein n=1 Tax=Kitasatospora sp. NPDC036755 TaxID=3154600 RepID=UPI0033D6889C